ncbi:putative MFS family arabinose efflux permease [Kibdelosporangium banguiense]|uniref:MFS family arabinose efflux permease n=1 Tax=Kibdelosporangium banguiense TaxID=1365924 RepID=A0ABS4TTL1_9PSEU|nr:MFS transporter [Kibdelosporangium banguiense]MBP2327266.1 putative MFS family arabinose efflux permease [Kibdelosporangium banguiense]
MTNPNLPSKIRNVTGLLTALVLVVIVVQLCNAMLIASIPDMARRIGTSTESIGLTQAFYFLAAGLAAVALAGYSDFTDRRRLVLLVLAVTCVGIVVAAVAPTIDVLFAGRVLQGASGGLFPLVLRVLQETVPAGKFGWAMGIVSAAYAGSTGVDGLIGGWLTDNYGFRAVLAFMFLVAVTAMFVTARTLPELPRATAGRLDRAGLVLLCLSLTVVQIGAGLAGDAGFLTAGLVIAVGVALFAAFWWVERRTDAPLVPTGYLRSRQAWPVLATSALIMAGLLSVLNYTVPVLSQDRVHGYGNTAMTTALLFIVPVAAVNLVFSPIAGHLAGRIGWHRVLRFALACSVPVVAVLAYGYATQWLVVTLVAVFGLFSAMALTAINGLSVLLAPDRNLAVLPGVNSTAFAIGASLGITSASQIIAASPGGDPSSPAVYQLALWMTVITAAAAFLVSLTVAETNDQRIPNSG